jgi:hypothetical protein
MIRQRSGHERIYRWLLRCYPSPFRTRFADEMVQLFGDQLRDTRTGGETAGVARTWLRTLWDLAVTAPSEHASGRSVAHSLSTPPSIATRALGVLGILGGAMLLAAWIPDLPWSHEAFNLRLVLFNLGAIAIAIAVHRRQSGVSRRLSLATAVPAILANAWYLVMVLLSIGRPVFPEADPGFRSIFFYAAIILWLSDAGFGLGALRIGGVSRWASLTLTIGSLLALFGIDRLGFTTGPLAWLIQPLALLGVFLVGVGWIWLGFDVATHRRLPEVQRP